MGEVIPVLNEARSKHLEDWSYSCTQFQPHQWRSASYTASVLPLRKDQFHRRLDGPDSQFGHFRDEKNFFSPAVSQFVIRVSRL